MSFSSVEALTSQLVNAPDEIVFSDVISFVDDNYTFTPSAFSNGAVNNEANQNNGSCKLLALGQLLGLTEAQTLALFGSYYRDDVLKHPEGTDHANIRNFMVSGFDGLQFDTFPLAEK